MYVFMALRVFKDGENQCCVLIPCIVHCENCVLHSHLKGCDIVDDLHQVKLFVVGRVVWNGQMHVEFLIGSEFVQLAAFANSQNATSS